MFPRLTGSNFYRLPVRLPNNHLVTLSLLILCMGILPACQQATPKAEVEDRITPAPEITGADTIDQLIEELPPLIAIKRLLEMAEKKPADQGFRLRQKAVQLSIDHEAPTTTGKRIATLRRQYPTGTYQVRIEILKQKLLLAQGRPDDVRANIDSIRLLATAEEEIQLMELKADALTQGGLAIKGAQLRIELDKLYADHETARKQQNDQRLWRSLMRLTPDTISSHISEIADTFSGWLELAYLNRQGQHNPALLNRSIDQWSQRHPDHPAHRYIIEIIRQRQIAVSNHPQHIALLLPLSGKLQNIGQAIRDGFLANYLEIRQQFAINTVIDIHDTGGNPELATLLFQQASESGADFIVGPLDKAAVAAVAMIAADRIQEKSDQPGPPAIEPAESLTPEEANKPNPSASESIVPPRNQQDSTEATRVPLLVLNQLPQHIPESGSDHKIYQFTLAPESEAIQAASQAHLDGRRHAMVIVPANTWGNRLYEAFAAAYQKPGGTIVTEYRYPRETPDHSRGIQQALNLNKSRIRHQRLQQLLSQDIKFAPGLRRDIELIFMAASPQEARQIKSQLKFYYADHIPIYATSHIYTTRPDAVRDKDLDGIYFTDMPWILNDKPAPGSLRKILRDNWPADMTEQYPRFYALGADIFRLLPQIEWLTRHTGEQLNGETGRLSLSDTGIVERESHWAVFRDGIPITWDDAGKRE